jgi:2'-5' RNA ligase
MPRLFLALWPEPAVRDALYHIAQAAHLSSGGRLMRRDNLHQTLVFIGAVDDRQVATIMSAGADIKAQPFTLEFSTTGYWRHNRIVWAGPLTMPATLVALVAALEERLAQANIAYDHRPYSAHVTLVRAARAPAPLKPVRFVWPVRDFVLLESARDAKAVGYRVIARWPLAA